MHQLLRSRAFTKHAVPVKVRSVRTEKCHFSDKEEIQWTPVGEVQRVEGTICGPNHYTLDKGYEIIELYCGWKYAPFELQSPAVRFSKDPKTLRARKAIRKTPTRLLCKAGVLICCKGNKN